MSKTNDSKNGGFSTVLSVIVILLFVILAVGVIVVGYNNCATDTPPDDTSAGGTLEGGDDEESMVYYHLLNNVTLTENITITGYVTLCLHGYILTGTGDGSVITVSDGAYFVLYDCQDGVTDESGDYVVNNVVNNETYHSGVITGGNATYGGGVYVNYGTFIMESGEISGYFRFEQFLCSCKRCRQY